MEALPDEAWLELVWRLYLMRPGRRWYGASADLDELRTPHSSIHMYIIVRREIHFPIKYIL